MKNESMKRTDSIYALRKRAYTSPKLIQYGSVKTLTKAAATGSSEGSGSTNPHMSAMGSDVRLKENIVPVGRHSLGFGLYLFDYKPKYRGWAGHGRYLGVMAQEVETVMPEAVLTGSDGFKRVNYAVLGIDLTGRSVH